MATEDDEIYSDTPSNESVRDVRLIRNMFEVATKSTNPVQGNPAKPTARGINGIGPKPPAKFHPVPRTTGNSGGTPPTVPSKTAVPLKASTSSKVPPPPTNHLDKARNGTGGAVRPVPHNGISEDKILLQSVLRRKKPSVTTTPTQPLKIPSDCSRISELPGDRSTVYPPNDTPAVSSQHPSHGTSGYCVVSPHRLHPRSPQPGKGSLDLMVSGNKKNYRKLPVPTTRTPAPRKKPLPPGLPMNFAQKFMADMKMAKKVNAEAKISTDRDSDLLAYDDLYEDVGSYVN